MRPQQIPADARPQAVPGTIVERGTDGEATLGSPSFRIAKRLLMAAGV